MKCCTMFKLKKSDKYFKMKSNLFQDNNPFSDTYQQQEQIEKHMMRDPHVSKPGGKILKKSCCPHILAAVLFSYILLLI